MNRIRPPIEDLPKHQAAMSWMNEIIMDLKLQLAGIEPINPITAERLQEGEKLHDELGKCRERTLFY